MQKLLCTLLHQLGCHPMKRMVHFVVGGWLGWFVSAGGFHVGSWLGLFAIMLLQLLEE